MNPTTTPTAAKTTAAKTAAKTAAVSVHAPSLRLAPAPAPLGPVTPPKAVRRWPRCTSLGLGAPGLYKLASLGPGFGLGLREIARPRRPSLPASPCRAGHCPALRARRRSSLAPGPLRSGPASLRCAAVVDPARARGTARAGALAARPLRGLATGPLPSHRGSAALLLYGVALRAPPTDGGSAAAPDLYRLAPSRV